MELIVNSKATPKEGAACELKAGSSTFTILELIELDLNGIARTLSRKVKEAPNFFKDAPVVIDLGQISRQQKIDYERLGRLLREFGLFPIGVCNGQADQLKLANSAGLATIAARAQRKKTPKPVDTSPPAPAIDANLVVQQPVRSGQQIYAKEGDLVVLASVSQGAEVLADGNIHIYGALRGRVLAGIQGNQHARIFCQSLEAELIAIAGCFQVNEDIDRRYWKSPVHIYLEDDNLHIQPL